MLSWKEKVANRLARLLADSPVSPSTPTSAAVEPQVMVGRNDMEDVRTYTDVQYNQDGVDLTDQHLQSVLAISFPVEHFTSPQKGSLSSYVISLLPSSNSGHEINSTCSEIMRPLPPESLPKRWRGNDFSWKDQPLELSEESDSESEKGERNRISRNNQILESYRSVDNRNGNEDASTSDCLGSVYYLTEKSTFVSPKLFWFFQSSLPGTLKGCHWVLLYSTWKHGISLRTLLRRSENLQGLCILIAGDMQGAVFGGLLNGPLRPTEKRKYQGTNQTFVFTTIYGEPKIFRPTGANRYYYMCLKDILAFGGGRNFALRLDEDLLHGTSGSCETFGNSCLAHLPEFELKNVELWAFTHSPGHST